MVVVVSTRAIIGRGMAIIDSYCCMLQSLEEVMGTGTGIIAYGVCNRCERSGNHGNRVNVGLRSRPADEGP